MDGCSSDDEKQNTDEIKFEDLYSLVGKSKGQIRFIMGKPTIIDNNNSWTYEKKSYIIILNFENKICINFDARLRYE